MRPLFTIRGLSAGSCLVAYEPLHSLTSDSKKRSPVIKTSTPATAEKRPSAQSLPPLSWHCCIHEVSNRSAARTPGDSAQQTILVEELKKTTQEDVPKRSQKSLPSKSDLNEPSVPRPNHFPELPQVAFCRQETHSPKTRCPGKHLKTTQSVRAVTTPSRISRRFLQFRLP